MSAIEDKIEKLLPDAAAFLERLVSFQSVEGREGPAQECVARALADAGLEVHLEGIDEALREDPEFTPGNCASFEGRANVVARLAGAGGARTLIINTHSDVVPAVLWPEGFVPAREGGMVSGRGAVDAKGQVAAIYLAAAALAATPFKPAGDVEIQVVIDEEVGGNGTLSLIRSGHTADAAVVMEPTSLAMHTANRGALWFRFEIEGRGSHMARKFEGESAIDHARELIDILYRLEAEMLDEARTHPLFKRYSHPVQVNVGKLIAGDWPASVASKAVLEGGIGFLPGRTIADMKRILRERVEREAGAWLGGHYRLDFLGLHNEPFETPPDAAVVGAFSQTLVESGLDGAPSGWIASCDARLFAKVAGIDTIVFGAGDLAAAHSGGESVELGEIRLAAEVLARFIQRWCR